MGDSKYFEVTLRRSIAGRPEVQRRVIAGLGLTRFGRTVFLKDTPTVRGMLAKAIHLVAVTPHQGEMPKKSARQLAAE